MSSFVAALEFHTTLDFVRLASGLLGAYFCGMALTIMWLYRDRKPIYHVRWIASGNVVFVGALVYAQLGLIGQPQTRVSWIVAVATIVGLVPMCLALHSLMKKTHYER